MSGIVGGAGSRSGIIGQTELDYETGTFTPIVKDVSGDATSMLWSAAYYTKIGRQVTIAMQFDINTDIGSATSGDVGTIHGLPFTCMNTNNIFKGACHVQRGSYGGDYLVSDIMANTATMKIGDCVSGTGTSTDYLTIGEMMAHVSSAPTVTVTYFTA